MRDYFTLEKKSIKEALSHDWVSAIATNREILKSKPEDINTLNRLAKALIEINEISEAKVAITHILSLDCFNTVAKNNLERLKNFQKNSTTTSSVCFNHICFIEEPGKTLVVNLVNIGNPLVTNKISVGQEVTLNPTGRKIKVINQKDQYLGSLPDDICIPLLHFIKLGNKYQTLIKSSNCHQIIVFIRETKKSSRAKGMDSFPKTKSNSPTLTPHKLNESPLEIFDTHSSNDSEDNFNF
jgi:hypothetical protein